jgi:hypothetical protein
MLIDHPERDFVVGLWHSVQVWVYVSKNLKTVYLLPEIVDGNLLDEVK